MSTDALLTRLALGRFAFFFREIAASGERGFAADGASRAVRGCTRCTATALLSLCTEITGTCGMAEWRWIGPHDLMWCPVPTCYRRSTQAYS